MCSENRKRELGGGAAWRGGRGWGARRAAAAGDPLPAPGPRGPALGSADCGGVWVPSRERLKGSSQPEGLAEECGWGEGEGGGNRLESRPSLLASTPSSRKQIVFFPGFSVSRFYRWKSLSLFFFLFSFSSFSCRLCSSHIPLKTTKLLPKRKPTPPRPSCLPRLLAAAPLGTDLVAPHSPARTSSEKGRLCNSFYCILDAVTALELDERLKF